MKCLWYKNTYQGFLQIFVVQGPCKLENKFLILSNILPNRSQANEEADVKFELLSKQCRLGPPVPTCLLLLQEETLTNRLLDKTIQLRR